MWKIFCFACYSPLILMLNGPRWGLFTLMKSIKSPDLLKFGFIPEFIGRLPVLATLHGLSEADLVRVLTEPKNSLARQYEKFFHMEGVELKFTQDALEEVAKRAISKGTGARALRSIL